MAEEIVVPGASSEELIRCALPITKVTAMVSPSARPNPSIMPPTMPTRECGTTTFHITSQVVAPSPYPDSLSMGGTVSKTSRMIAAMNGSTMMARTTPAVSTPMPNGGPLNKPPNSDTWPRCAINQGCTCRCSTGASTNNPQMPKMMLGTAASNSTATPIGRLSSGGQSSVKNSAMPKPAGTASSIAINEVTIVP